MKIKHAFFLIVFLTISNVFSQVSLNDYKYVLVPEKYEFFKKANKYRLNELTEFLFQKEGFETLSTSNEYPEDLAKNGCLALRADVIKDSGLLKTKLKVILKDCRGNKVYETKVGQTREKDLNKAYNLALRDAFTSFNAIDYKYNDNEDETLTSNEVSNSVKSENKAKIEAETKAKEIQRLKEEIEALKREKQKQIETERVEVKKNISESKVKKESIKETIIDKSKVTIEPKINNNFLYAQEIENGFQLVDRTPKVVMVLLKTPRKDTYIVKDENATVYKEDGVWYISKTEGDKVVTKTLNIKF